ncbi:MAG: TetR/AcrR family transcriptional regulator [Actinobacteria bacterium]|nr:TetR/AcrR family transcriptional regulator [Actinomycetota bacterium]
MQTSDSRERILQATRARLNSGGILGLRVADVAKDADTSITLIYKYYRDRDGLLAQALGDMYDEFRQRQMQRIDTWLSQNETITLEQFASLTPNPAEETKPDRDFRLQMLATALENEELHARIKKATNDVYKWTLKTMEVARKKLPVEDQGFDGRFVSVIMFNMMFVFYDLLDDNKISASEYREMLVSHLRNSARK